MGMVVSWMLRLCVDSLWKTGLHTDLLWTSQKNMRIGIKMSVSCHAVIFDFKYPGKKLLKLDIEEGALSLPMFL